MKAVKNYRLVQALLLLAGAAVLFIGCSSREVSPVAPSQVDQAIRVFSTGGGRTITGLVRDLQTDAGVPGAAVSVIDTAGGEATLIASGVSDAAGKYVIPGVPIDTLIVFIAKEGYIEASVTAFVEDYYWSVNLKTTYIHPVSSTQVIGSAGGQIRDSDEEGDVIILDVPPGALAADVRVTLTHLQGREIPSVPPRDRISFATAQVGPTGTVFQNPAALTFPLPGAMTPGTEIPLYELDLRVSAYWQDTGIKASINADGLTASAPVTRSALYSIMPLVRMEEARVDTLWEQVRVLPSARGFFTVTYKNQYRNTAPENVDFPDGASGLSHSTLIAMLEQVHGVPFLLPQTETVFYESPTGMYPYQAIRVLSQEGQMILPDPLAPVPFRIYIKRPRVRFVPHDQGCGF
jgi:hypothetical protein